MMIESSSRETSRWKEFRWWLLSASGLTIIAAVCVAFIMQLLAWGGFAVLIALGSLPFVGEAWVQFRSWWRRILWVFAGVVTGVFVVEFFPSLENPFSDLFTNWPLWIRGPVTFLPSACFEFTAALNNRNRPWTWLIVTPALFGLSAYWMEFVGRVAEKAMVFITTYVSVVSGPASELYVGAAIFGTVLFTRALTGSLIASRKAASP
jgi:hypothetical protein